jgi:hypothetical protein
MKVRMEERRKKREEKRDKIEKKKCWKATCT